MIMWYNIVIANLFNDAQLNSLKDIIMMSKRVIFGYPQGIILQNYVDGFHQI